MKITNMFNKLCVGLAMLCGLSFTSCEQGLTYEEAPESYYTEVSLGSTPFYLRSRQLFPDMVYGVNWKQWAPNYVYTSQISWETSMTEESSNDAPDGKLYVINVKANTKATFKTQNKGFLFVGSKFSGNYEFKNATTTTIDGRSETTAQEVVLPVDKTQIIGELVLTNPYDCVVERVDNAPVLGQPADFSSLKARYLVKNICYRPAGVDQVTRLYEVRITFADQP